MIGPRAIRTCTGCSITSHRNGASPSSRGWRVRVRSTGHPGSSSSSPTGSASGRPGSGRRMPGRASGLGRGRRRTRDRDAPRSRGSPGHGCGTRHLRGAPDGLGPRRSSSGIGWPAALRHPGPRRRHGQLPCSRRDGCGFPGPIVHHGRFIVGGDRRPRLRRRARADVRPVADRRPRVDRRGVAGWPDDGRPRGGLGPHGARGLRRGPRSCGR